MSSKLRNTSFYHYFNLAQIPLAEGVLQRLQPVGWVGKFSI
ncbi:hypothetical protein [Campylobacter troglodytis]|nr:hypothetical protein [Campylobacter troglodytis]